MTNGKAYTVMFRDSLFYSYFDILHYLEWGNHYRYVM